MDARPTRPATRLAALDLLRFVAAMLVVLYHVVYQSGRWGELGPGAPARLLTLVGRYGYLGVHLFFMISGYVILLTAWRKDVIGFVASRVARLFPAYIPSVVLCIVLGLSLVPSAVTRDAATDIVNMTMFQGARAALDLSGVYWTLWAELRFYFLIGILIAFGVTRPRILLFSLLWPLIGVIAHTSRFTFLDTLLVGDMAPLFAAGMLLYLTTREGWNTVTTLIMILNLALALPSVATTAAELTHVGIAVNPNVAVLVVITCFLLLVLVTTTRITRWNSPVLTWLGLLTYPLYLVHLEAAHLVGRRIDPLGRPYLAIALIILVAIAAAIALHYAAERPFTRKVNAVMDRSLRKAFAPQGRPSP